MSDKPTLIVIVGPTAIGKTSLSIKLAKHFKCEILSADSRQFYKEMEIGTAKPTSEEMNGIPHHFVNNLSIHDEYTAGKFEIEALEKLDSLFQSNSTAILVGGSGLFVDAVCFGFDNVPPTNEEVRKKLILEFESNGIEILQNRLKEVDPIYFEKVDLENPHRVMRALEVFETTGKPYSSFRTEKKSNRDFNCIFIGLNLEREQVYERINLRVDIMLNNGLLKEVEQLRAFKDLKPLRTVGYQEFYSEEDQELAIEKVKQNTRRFAKRQLTWFKKYEGIKWFNPKDYNNILQHITSIKGA